MTPQMRYPYKTADNWHQGKMNDDRIQVQFQAEKSLHDQLLFPKSGIRQSKQNEL